MVATALPVSTRAGTDRRYAVVDPYLRFYLRFLDAGYGEINGGVWETYLRLAIEPLIRQ